MKLKFGFENGSNPIADPPPKGRSRNHNKEVCEITSPHSVFIPALGSSTGQTKLESMKELQRLVGLENVKSLIEEIVAYVKIERRRQQRA